MNSVLNSCVFLTVFSLSIYIILRIFSRSYSAVFKSEETHAQNPSSKSNGVCESQETRRDMGFYESYLADLNKRFGTKIYVVLSLKSEITLRRENINNTLLLLSRKHSTLRGRVTSDHSTHACQEEFVISPEERFVPELRFVNTSNWKMILEEELIVNNERLLDQLLWKTIVLRQHYEAKEKLYINTLLFLFDPVIVDRISSVRFTEDFIAVLCQLVNCDIHVDNTRTVNLDAPTEELLRPPCLVWLFSMFKLALWKLMKFAQRPVSNQHKVSRRCKFLAKPLVVMKCLSKHETSLFLKYCHHLDCSLTALFITAWSEIMSGRTGSSKALCHRRPVTVVVDYRTSMSSEIPLSYLSNSSSCFHLQLMSKGQDRRRHFGSTARYCEELLSSAVKHKAHLDLLWLLKYRGSRTELHPVASSPLEISNVGTFRFQPTRPFSLHGIFIGASNTSNVNLTLLIVNEKLYCGMHLASQFSGCADLLSALFAKTVQSMSINL